MTSTAERYGWGIAFAVLIAFAVPWFMWGDSRTAVGLPLWLWWHVVWMGLATGVFWLFANRAWGLGILETVPASGGDDTGRTGRRGGDP